MKKKQLQIIGWLNNQIKIYKPDKNTIKGASLGLSIITALLWIVYSIKVYVNLKDWWVLLYLLTITLITILFALVIKWGIKLLISLPRVYLLSILISIPLLLIMSHDLYLTLILTILSSFCGAIILYLKKTRFQSLTIVKRLTTIMIFIIGFGGLITIGYLYNKDGFNVAPITNAALYSELNIQPIEAPSPAEKGSYIVKKLTYGSGEDFHRNEYGTGVNIKTNSVNGLAFVDNQKGFKGWWRKKYWGFDNRSLPINARVWYPVGDGPFALALIVHGNHAMQDYSDTGYEYLADLLASKGIITASIDQNFFNDSWSNILSGSDKENDARAWLLLEHLKVWHKWNQTKDHQFFKKIDTSNIALIGHSRGGEAVAHAAIFNKLPFYPDDASVKFDYNYNIKSIIAIAPVDGQYKPGGTKTEIKDINYLALHGSQDGDVSSFMGSQQYERVKFKDSMYHFKSGVYIYGANHGQFNSSWSDNDTETPFLGLLNLKQLLQAEDQRKIAKTYISSFLDITLKNKREYLPLFIDARKGKEWLPKTIYLNQFEDSNLKPIANFDEDIDVSTITQNGGRVNTRNLSVWREQEIQLKRQKKGSRALFLGWNNDINNKTSSTKSVPESLTASYTISLSSNSIDSTYALVFSMAESNESSNPKSNIKLEKNDSENNKGNTNENKKDKIKKPIDFTIQLVDSFGQKVSFPLSKFSHLQREIEVVITKIGFLKGDIQSEKIFQTFYFPIKDFLNTNPNFDLHSIKKVKFLFDKSESGVIVIDNIGFMKNL